MHTRGCDFVSEWCFLCGERHLQHADVVALGTGIARDIAVAWLCSVRREFTPCVSKQAGYLRLCIVRIVVDESVVAGLHAHLICVERQQIEIVDGTITPQISLVVVGPLPNAILRVDVEYVPLSEKSAFRHMSDRKVELLPMPSRSTRTGLR